MGLENTRLSMNVCLKIGTVTTACMYQRRNCTGQVKQARKILFKTIATIVKTTQLEKD